MVAIGRAEAICWPATTGWPAISGWHTTMGWASTICWPAVTPEPVTIGWAATIGWADTIGWAATIDWPSAIGWAAIQFGCNGCPWVCPSSNRQYANTAWKQEMKMTFWQLDIKVCIWPFNFSNLKPGFEREEQVNFELPPTQLQVSSAKWCDLISFLTYSQTNFTAHQFNFKQ